MKRTYCRIPSSECVRMHSGTPKAFDMAWYAKHAPVLCCRPAFGVETNLPQYMQGASLRHSYNMAKDTFGHARETCDAEQHGPQKARGLMCPGNKVIDGTCFAYKSCVAVEKRGLSLIDF